MFVVDFISAGLLAFVLTVIFAAIIRRGGYRRVRELTGAVWALAVGSWLGGALVVAVGPVLTGTHWIPFAFSALLIGLLVIGLWSVPSFKRSVHTSTGQPGSGARSAIAAYFFVTLLLFFCAISVRFYIAHIA